MAGDARKPAGERQAGGLAACRTPNRFVGEFSRAFMYHHGADFFAHRSHGGDPVKRFSVGVIGMLIFLLALAAFCPALIRFAVGWFWRSKLRLPGIDAVEPRLASDSLRRNPARSGITVATVVISLAAIFTIAAFVSSVRGSLLTWVDQMVTADLIVSSGARTAGPRNVPLREDLLPELKKIAGIKIIDLYRLIRSSYRQKPILIESFSARDSAAVRNLPMLNGDGRRALREMAQGKGVIVSESFQSKFGKGVNDRIELITPSGLIGFDIIGVYVDYSSDSGSVLLDRALYKKYWKDDLVDAFDLWLEPGTNEAAIAETIKARYGEPLSAFHQHASAAQTGGGAHHGAILRRKLCS